MTLATSEFPVTILPGASLLISFICQLFSLRQLERPSFLCCLIMVLQPDFTNLKQSVIPC